MDTQTPKVRPNWLYIAAAGIVFVITVRYWFDTFLHADRTGQPVTRAEYVQAASMLVISFVLTMAALKPWAHLWRNFTWPPRRP